MQSYYNPTLLIFEPQTGHEISLCSFLQFIQLYLTGVYCSLLPDKEENDLNKPFASGPVLFSIILVLIMLSNPNAPKATIKDAGNDRIKAIAPPTKMYMPVHFS